jgi:hypothetical protein
MPMEINIKVKYWMEINMEKECIYMLAAISMMENGKMINKVEVEGSIFQTT